ncbi:hypothetical protein WJX81_005973 [Elliptochloris bilobata]|uniref:dihydropyrimidinase n=1 Tax=Elliptochloris bilobata TaxID=381761 RepID=A0AAW1RKE1_9CHLO
MHIHVCGGGGEAGPASRCPEAPISALVDAGITTLVGVLGTDTVSRSQENLVAKCRALAAEGLTARHWAGGYAYPPPTVTGSAQRDVALLESCVGVGEVAVSDHRGSAPTAVELARLASEVRVGGMLSSKAGLTYCHMGTAASRLDSLRAALAAAPGLPRSAFLPTHVERTPELAADGLCWLREGGCVDLTAGKPARVALAMYYREDPALLERVSVSSDAFGSWPVFDERGSLTSYQVTAPSQLLACLRALVLEDGWPLERALPLFTSHPAARLKLARKGRVAAGCDADLLLLDKDSLELRYVIAGGVVLRTPEWTRGCFYERGERIRPLLPHVDP